MLFLFTLGADVSSLSLMALSCAENSVPESYRSHFERHFNKTMDCILSKQNEDGSVGNHISTALASQVSQIFCSLFMD